MDFYKASLTGLLVLCAVLYAVQHLWEDATADEDTKRGEPTEASAGAAPGTTAKEAARARRAKAVQDAAAAAQAARAPAFLVVYGLVMAADWLQGPYLYALYTDRFGVSPAGVSLLFATGFVAGGVSAPFVGALADRYGRKRASGVFCAVYVASCQLTVGSPWLPALLLGRILGGIGTSLLFSVFESWMVADFWKTERRVASRAGGEDSGDDDSDAARTKERDASERHAAARLSHRFGRMGTLNSLVAIASGVFSDWVVGATGTPKAPFAASALLLCAAAVRIHDTWEENYGEAAARDEQDGGGRRVGAVLGDPVVLVLGLASTLFEGSMYLFVFFWTPALKEAALSSSSTTTTTTSSPLPYGIIFASFMAAAMAATLAFNLVTARLRLVRCVTLLLGLLGGAEVVFYLLSSPSSSSSSSSSSPAAAPSPGLSEHSVFWLFCLFEACVGIYWPCMGFLKGRLVPDGARAQVYALLRVPLNVFVVAALLLTRGGTYAAAFGACAALLLAAMAAVLAMMLSEPSLP